MNRRARFLARDPREPYTGAPAPEPKEPKPSWWDTPVTYKRLVIFMILSAPFVGFGRGLAEVLL